MGKRTQMQMGHLNIIKTYNEGMRGVDMMDKLLESYHLNNEKVGSFAFLLKY